MAILIQPFISLCNNSTKRTIKNGNRKPSKPSSHISLDRDSSKHSSSQSKHLSDSQRVTSNFSTQPQYSPQYSDGTVQWVSKSRYEKSHDDLNPPQDSHTPTQPWEGNIPSHLLPFQNYQPYPTNLPSVNSLGSYPENPGCLYHSSVLSTQYDTYNGTRGEGSSPIDRWARETQSEEGIIMYNRDGSSTLRPGCSCDQAFSPYSGFGAN